jgi:hypothetical protein
MTQNFDFNHFDFKQNRDLDQALLDADSGTLTAGRLTGRWLNTDRNTRGLSEIRIAHDAERFTVGATGVGADRPIEWQAKTVKALANLEEEAGQRGIALAADFDFGYMFSQTYLRINKGVLVIVLFNTFRDDSGRTDYVTREFFYRAD